MKLLINCTRSTQKCIQGHADLYDGTFLKIIINVNLTHSFPMHPFSTLMKTSENRKVFRCFQGVEKGTLGINGLKSLTVLAKRSILDGRGHLLMTFAKSSQFSESPPPPFSIPGVHNRPNWVYPFNKSSNYLFRVVPSSNTIYNTRNTNDIPLMNIKHNVFLKYLSFHQR